MNSIIIKILYFFLILFNFRPAFSEIHITYKSAKSTSSYYQMAIQVADTIKKSTNGQIILTIEESQGSVQNVREVKERKGNYVFTTPPVLVKLAIAKKAMFKGEENKKYKNIRALFPIPSLTMHFVMSKKSGITSFQDMEGKTILLGKGSFSAKEGAKYIKKFGLEGKVKYSQVELSNAVHALKNGQIDGFVSAGSYPAPNVIEAAASMSVNVISLNNEQIKSSKRTKLIIPAGTYLGQNNDISTTSLPVVAYTTTNMSDEVAYNLTKAFWNNKVKLGEKAEWWNGVKLKMLSNISTIIHDGSLKFYQEIGANLEANHYKSNFHKNRVIQNKFVSKPKITIPSISSLELEQEKQKRIASQKKADEEERKRKKLERKLAALEKQQKVQQQTKPKIAIAKKPKPEFPLKPIPINFTSVSVKRDDIAVIIGNANYKKQGKDIPNVNPAYADSEGIKQYFMKAKGVREGNIIYLKDATNAQLLSVFGNEKSHKGKLFNYIKPKKSNVYVYYVGHGAPGEEGDAYLVPTDTDSQTIQFTGYQLSTLYSNLGKLPAKSVTVILEACFSGGSQTGSLISKASPIIITPKKTMIPANVKVIAAGSERQMASWEEDSSHSLFTKYFLKAMSGEGDANKDGKVSDAELKEYLSDTMTYYARRYYGRDQKVQIHNGG